MVFCAYCGKSFTRKEHLERHIPSHTNVKPHRCSACQLSFARRDLLQRHHATYHEARDPMEPLPGGVPSIPGRQPIACLNCAQAKTGCDKRVPCARCADKNLPCAARFARRSSKIRAAQAQAQAQAQASAAMQNQLSPTQIPATQQPAQSPQPSLVANFNSMDIDVGVKTDVPSVTHSEPAGLMSNRTIDPRLHHHSSPMLKKSHSNPRRVDDFPSPHTNIDALDEFMHLAPDFVGATEPTFQDLLVWPDYPLDMDIYGSALPLAPSRADIPMPSFGDISDISSEPISSRGSVHTRHTSIVTADFDPHSHPHTKTPSTSSPCMATVTLGSDSTEIPEFEVVVAAEAAWPLARCTQPIYSGTCPKTAIVHLECLEQKSKQEGTWHSLEKYLDSADWDSSDLASVVPLSQRTRDKMLAITQSFLHKALDIHRGGRGSSRFGSPSGGDWNFLVLPPTNIVEYFLRSYVRSLSPYYSLVYTGTVDPNEMLRNNQASTLLVLLMIAQGAAMVPMAEARYLSAGLTETCRINLFDIIEKDVELSADPVMLRCALLFTLLGAWSGDKWLMDIAMGQRGMYLSMLKHAGMLEPQLATSPAFNSTSSPDLQWQAWLHQESRNRLVYNWVMVDQELSLFHDTAPQLSITDLQCPLPGPESLWMATSANEWSTRVQSVYGSNVSAQLIGNPAISPSLCDLFQDFLHDNLSRRQGSLSAQQLRLLLHPLQSMLCHLRQMLSCFSDLMPGRSRSQRSVTKAGTMQRLEEVQQLLQKWYELSLELKKKNPKCPVSRCNIVLYHLISLNAVTNFPEIERIARREGFESLHSTPGAQAGSSVSGISLWEIALRHKRCIYQREEAVFHSGQVLRLLRDMDPARRPAWWSAALYRAILILWVDSLARMDPSFQSASAHSSPSQQQPQQAASPGKEGASPGNPSTPATQHSAATNNTVPIDQVTPEDPSIIAFLWHGEGVPVLSGQGMSNIVTLGRPDHVLRYGARVIEEGISSRISDGIKRKLVALGQAWNVDTLVSSSPAMDAMPRPPVGTSMGVPVTHVNPSAVGLGVSLPGMPVAVAAM